jgi:hypothetical protein
MAPHPGSVPRRKRQPSRLAQQLTDAFAPCAEWSEVRVVRNASGRRDRVVTIGGGSAEPTPYDWAAAA